MNEKSFNAMVVSQVNGDFIREITERKISGLPAGDLLISVKYSSLNY